MIMGYLFFWAVIISMVLVAADRAIQGLMIECQSCGRDRFLRSYCTRCGVVGNEAPEPPKKNSRSTHVRFH